MMKILILAAGEQTRWGDPDNPKQLVDIAGEPLLARIVRQCRAAGCEPVIVSHDERLWLSDEHFVPAMRRCTCETLLHTRSLWKGRTIVLLGDVIYSPGAFEKIVASRELLQVFGRQELRYRIVGRYYEIFALSFDATVHERMAQMLLDCVLGPVEAPLYGKLRDFYERWCGLPSGRFQHENGVFYPIEDWTEDIDAPEDYVQFQQMIVKRGWIHDASPIRIRP